MGKITHELISERKCKEFIKTINWRNVIKSSEIEKEREKKGKNEKRKKV